MLLKYHGDFPTKNKNPIHRIITVYRRTVCYNSTNDKLYYTVIVTKKKKTTKQPPPGTMKRLTRPDGTMEEQQVCI